MTTSRAMVMPVAGAPLELVERPRPEPGPGEVVVRVRACSLNYHDLVNLMGLIDGPWPRVPLTDGAGEVVAVGEGVGAVSVGDHVVGAFHPSWPSGPPTREAKRLCPGDSGDGWLQQHQRFPAAAVVRAPAGLSMEEAATLPCAAVTAWSALRTAGLRPGQVVVTLGTGGVSVFALQLALAHGAVVVATSSSDDKLEHVRELGAQHVVNHRTAPEWHTAVKRLTGGVGADVVVDVVGPETLDRSVRAVRVGGSVIIAGVLSGAGAAEVPVAHAMTRNVRLQGVTVGSVADLDDLCRAVEATGLRPRISHLLDWTEVAEGARLMGAGEHLGKVVVRVP